MKPSNCSFKKIEDGGVVFGQPDREVAVCVAIYIYIPPPLRSTVETLNLALFTKLQWFLKHRYPVEAPRLTLAVTDRKTST